LRAQLIENKEEILSLLRGAERNGDSTPPPIRRISREERIPLSYAQQRLWFIDQLEPGNPAYNLPLSVRLTGPLDITALEQSLSEVLRRHEALRTHFVELEGQPVQCIDDPVPLRLFVEDLSDMPADEREEELRQRLRVEAQQPFDLARSPLMRVRLLRSATDEHVLAVTMHHIASDGWSLNIFVGELASLYRAYAAGTVPSLPDLAVQYADYAVWQREWLQGEALEGHLAYWREQLRGAPPILELPTDRPRPATQTHHGAYQQVRISRELTDKLKALSHRNGATLFMTLLAGFQALLARYSGQEDIVVGSPVAGRTLCEIEGLIGFFVNTLVLQTKFDGDPTFDALLRRVREVALGAYAHQHVPFERLVEELQVQRDLSHTPLFQVMFVLQSAPPKELKLGALKLGSTGSAGAFAKFDITLSLEESVEGIVGLFEYNTDLFDPPRMERMAEHLVRLLEGAAAYPQQRISALPLMSHAELAALTSTRPPAPTAAGPLPCLHELFEQQVRRSPNAPAIHCGSTQLTYYQLNARAEALAHRLRARGVAAEVLVGLLCERSVEMIVSLLAVLKAGGAYVPLDPAYPRERLAWMVEDAKLQLVLAQRHTAEQVELAGAEVMCVEEEVETERCGVREEREVGAAGEVGANNAAYVIYTSGSTGRPKGVVVTHANVVRLFASTQHWFGFNERDVWTLFHSYAFDFSVWEIWGALLFGGKLVIVDYLTSRTPSAFYELLCRERVTVLNQTPSAFRQLLQTETGMLRTGASTDMHGDTSTAKDIALRLIIFGGEALELQTLQPWYQRRDEQHPQLVNMYGITETTVHVTYRPLRRADVECRAGSVIGGCIPDLELYILDERMQPVPVGTPGELYVGGAGLARGYLGRAELTAQRFVPHPFSEAGGARLYRTGDVGRYLSGGEIEYLGRVDEQVKVRGYRIEPGEIEAALREHEAVIEAVVQVREEPDGSKGLIAYVILKDESQFEMAELYQYAREKLPSHMIPNVFARLDELPLLPNGKIDRRALPALSQTSIELSGSFVSPRNDLELKLSDIWEDLLGTRPIGVKDDFFERGGHSLLAMRLFARIEREFGKRLPVSTLFNNPTIECLAGVLREVRELPSPWSPLVKLQPHGSNPPFFCVHPADGGVFRYLNLARYLGTEQPVYGLQASGLDEGQEPELCIPKMARRYVETVRTVQPEGPYLLGGWSMGGLIAVEMSRQLHEQGQKVNLLALIDTEAPEQVRLVEEEGDTRLLVSFTRELGLREQPQVSVPSRVESDEQLRRIFERARAHNILVPQADWADLSRLWWVYKTHVIALHNYVPQRSAVRLTVFRASEQGAQQARQPDLGWSTYSTEEVEVHPVPGNHYTIVDEPHVHGLAQLLRQCIERARQD
jgi:amino acid adenylation domain-containing protein